MKKALLVLGGLVVALVAAVVSIAFVGINKREKELNRKRTEPARMAKLEKKAINETSAQLDEELENLNVLTDEKES